MTAKPVVNTFTGLTDTPASITANQFVRGNSGATALEFVDPGLTNYLRRDGSNTITGAITGDTNNTRSFGSESVRFDKVWGRMGIFLGGDGVIDARFQGGATGPRHGGIIAGSQNLTGTMVHDMDSANTSFPAVALIGNTYNGNATSTAVFQNTGGGAVQFGSSYTTYGSLTSTIRTTAFGAFTTGYAWAYGANSTILNEASGAFCGGYPASAAAGGPVNVRVFNTGQGAFCWGRMPYSTGGSGARNIYARGPGSFVCGVAENNGSGVCLIQSNNNSKGSFVAGYVQGNSTFQAQLRTGNNDSGAFAQGAVRAVTELARIEASADGAFAQGYALNAIISTTGRGAFSQGSAAASYDIIASGNGAFAQGDSTAGAILAQTTNAVQFGPGTNALASSLAVGDISGTGIRIAGGGAPGTPVDGDVWKASGDISFRSNGVTVGAFNQPSVTGSRAGNAALASLLTQLANMNIVTDNSTA